MQCRIFPVTRFELCSDERISIVQSGAIRTSSKAAIVGVPVVLVPPAYTSQTCSRCHHVHPVKGKLYRNGKNFKCGHCGLEHDADVNAAKNIAALGLPVSQPESPGITCQLEEPVPCGGFLR